LRDPLLRVPKASAAFLDVASARGLWRPPDTSTLAVGSLLGGDAGLRCGEILALRWSDVDLTQRQLAVARSDWHGHVAATAGGSGTSITTGLAAAPRAPASAWVAGGVSDRRAAAGQIILYGAIRRAAGGRA
jgi:integrase